MTFRNIHALISFPKFFKLLFGVSASIQLIVITFNHLSGYYILDDSLHFITRFIFGTLLTLIGSFLIAYPDLIIIKSMNKFFSWHNHTFLRALFQFSLSIVVAAIIAAFITYLSHMMNPYREGLLTNMIYNILIFSVSNVILMLILEAWIFFIERNDSKQKSQELEGQLSQLRFEILKSQIDSHFMFNSLNVLSGLIDKDPKKAQHFIDEFSSIYRYVLEAIEKPLVSVNEELNFARSYMYLQQMRYGKNLQYSIDLPTSLLSRFLPPLSLQVVLENACKHNSINEDKPLIITISSDDDDLVISNNIHLKISSRAANGTGQLNLKKRYALLSDKLPEFRVGAKEYKVTLPLISEEKHECSDH